MVPRGKGVSLRYPGKFEVENRGDSLLRGKKFAATGRARRSRGGGFPLNGGTNAFDYQKGGTIKRKKGFEGEKSLLL